MSQKAMLLESGRLTVSVTPEGHGFQVRTETTVITDLGTQFGVIAHTDRSVEAHVLQGHIKVALDPNLATQVKSINLLEGQASTVDSTGHTLKGGLPARVDLFLLRVPSHSLSSHPSNRISLADMVGGGNGLGTGVLDLGVDLGTGRAFKHPPTEIDWSRRNQFLPIPDIRGIDGVFVPNRAWGHVAISSTGLLFKQCPETSGSFYGGPGNTGKFYDLLNEQVFTARFNGIDCGTAKLPALSLHPNAGITFDLEQIRQDHPTIPIERFTAICGIPKDLPETRFSVADVWILLDGDVTQRMRFPLHVSNIEKIDIPIPERTRFLTLVATCPGRADYSWIILGEPYLDAQDLP